VSYLLEGENPEHLELRRLAVSYAELALRNGEARDALTQLDKVFGFEPDQSDLMRRARRLRANALESLGDLEAAITELEALVVHAEAARRWDELARLTIDLVRCYQEAGDAAHSLDVGRTALDRIEHVGLAGSDVHAELASAVIGAYFVRGDLVKAGQLAAKAVADVDSRGSARARAATYWNASLLAESAQEISRALQLAEKALSIYADADDQRSLARLRVTYGWLLLRTTPPQPEAARDVLLAADTALQDLGSAIDRAYCETELGRASLLLGEPETALRYAQQATERLGDVPRLESAYVVLVRAAAMLALGRREEAVTNYRLAASLLASLELSRLAAAAWRELADAFAKLGLHQDAGLAYQQALSEAGVPAAPDLLAERSRSLTLPD
jgi:tetratricopeptide (TPR) repeat protein